MITKIYEEKKLCLEMKLHYHGIGIEFFVYTATYKFITNSPLVTTKRIVKRYLIHRTKLMSYFQEIRSSEVITEEESSKMKLNKRKLASQGSFKKAKEQAKMSIDGTSSKISGATPSSWNSCNHNDKKKLDVVCKGSGRRSSSIRRHRRPKKAKFPVGFVALNADYHYPNSHPPRHN